jgi:glutathione S-transferase
MVAENEIARGPNDARLHDVFGYQLDVDAARKKTAHLFALMESHLARTNWLALDRVTIADIACMPYVALSHQGGAPVDGYPAVAAWVQRVKALPGFVGMPGI